VSPDAAGSSALLDQASTYLDAGRALDAHHLAGRYLLQNPDSGDGLTVLALAEHRLGRHADAVASARRAVTASPHSDHAWRVLALVLVEIKAMQDAVTAAQRALVLAPHTWHTHTIAAVVFRESKDPGLRQRAVAEAETAVRLAPHEPDAHLEYGNTLLATADRKEARQAQAGAAQAYQQALRLDPLHRAARANLGMVQARKLRFLAASDAYAGVLGESPDDTVSRSNFIAAVGGVASATAWIGLAGLVISLWQPRGPAMAVIGITLLVVCTLIVRVVRRGRAYAPTVWREAPMLVVSLGLCLLGLVGALVLHLLTTDLVIIFLMVMPVALAGLIVYHVASSKLLRRAKERAGLADQAALADLDGEALRQRELFELDQQIDTQRRRTRGITRWVLVLALVLLIVALPLIRGTSTSGGSGWMAFGLYSVVLLVVGAVALRRAWHLRAMRHRRAELADADETS